MIVESAHALPASTAGTVPQLTYPPVEIDDPAVDPPDELDDGVLRAEDRGAEAADTDPARAIAALVGDAVAGEARARDRLLAVIHPMVLRYCRARLGRHESVLGSADDVAQEVCLAVVGALPHYAIRGLSFRAFVYGIAAHKVTDAFRAIGRNRSDPVPEVPDAPVDVDGPEHRALAVELGERLTSLLHVLTDRQREVIVLRIAVGLSAEETAQAVRSTPGAVRVTQHRALSRLREHLLDLEARAGRCGPPPAPRPEPGAQAG